jgi:oxygen-independent coproporphyrinogen-3 oxidase
VGLGAGAGTCVPGAFYLNTFSVPDYIATCSSGQLPIAMKMDFTEAMTRWYWMYWRLYDTYIPKEQMNAVFAGHPGQLERILSFIRRWRLCEEDDNGIKLTQRGAFWLHLMQNHFSLNYINRVWSAARKEAWPVAISF